MPVAATRWAPVETGLTGPGCQQPADSRSALDVPRALQDLVIQDPTPLPVYTSLNLSSSFAALEQWNGKALVRPTFIAISGAREWHWVTLVT